MKLAPAVALVAVSALSFQLAGCSAAEEAVGAASGGGGSFDTVYSTLLSKNCKGCHGPNAPGYNPGDTESSLDFTTADTAYTTLMGKAAGLSGNSAACNGVSFVVPGNAGASLLMASIDSTTRRAFSSGGCTKDTVAAMETRGGALTAAQVEAVRAWINGGATR
jgi:hypothetical protein